VVVVREWRWGSKGERETTICRLCSDSSSHARSIPDGGTDLRGFGCDCATACRGRLSQGLIRNTFRRPPLSLVFLTHWLYQWIVRTFGGLHSGLYKLYDFSTNLYRIYIEFCSHMFLCLPAIPRLLCSYCLLSRSPQSPSPLLLNRYTTSHPFGALLAADKLTSVCLTYS